MLKKENLERLAAGIRAGTRYAVQQPFPRESLKRQAQQRFRRKYLAWQVHRRGPRAVFELVDEIARHHPDFADDIDRRSERFAALDPALLRALGGDRFPARPLRVAGGGG
jgi:hypothetical protein